MKIKKENKVSYIIRERFEVVERTALFGLISWNEYQKVDRIGSDITVEISKPNIVDTVNIIVWDYEKDEYKTTTFKI